MTPDQIRKFYAVPVLADVPVVTSYGEGDFSYQGLRGLGQAAAPTESLFSDAAGKTKWLNVAMLAGAAAVAWRAWHS
jgi:hypothetical protein